MGWTLLWSGGLMLAFLAYQLWGTGLYNAAAQNRLEQELTLRLAAPPVATAASPAVVQAPASPVLTDAQAVPQSPPSLIAESPPGEGEALGRIIIPTAEVDDIMVEGVTREVLKKGPGHMPWTPLPGQPGNAVLSGHRTTYGAPFFYLDQITVGDDITVETAIGRHVFRVRGILVVNPTDVWVTDPREGAWLTLTTCTPRYSAAQRLVITAELITGPNLAAISGRVETTRAAPGA